MTQDIKYSDIKAAVQGLDPASAVEVAQIAQLAVKKAGVEGKYFDGSVPSPSGAVFVPTTDDYLGIQVAMSACVAAGGGTVQLKPGTIYNIGDNGLICVAGVHIVGSGMGTRMDDFDILTGTVIRSTSTTKPIIGFNYVDKGAPYALSKGSGGTPGFFDKMIQNVQIRNLMLDGGAYGIKIGALYESGIADLVVQNVSSTNAVIGGMWFENCHIINTNNTRCYDFGKFGFVYYSSGYTFWNFGQNKISHTVCQTPVRTAHKIIIGSRGTSGNLNDTHLDTACAIGGEILVTETVTVTAGSADIPVSDLSKYGLGCGVKFTGAFGTVSGLVDSSTKVNGSTYFVNYVSGTSGAGTIRIAAQFGSPTTITPGGTGTASVTLGGRGGCGIFFGTVDTWGTADVLTSCSAKGLDIEVSGTCGLVVQRVFGSTFDTQILPTGTTTYGSNIVLRGLSSDMFIRAASRPYQMDWDGAGFPSYHGILPNIVDYTNNGQPSLPPGSYYDPVKFAIRFQTSEGAIYGESSIAATNMRPLVGVDACFKLWTAETNESGQFGRHSSCVSYYGAAGSTYTLRGTTSANDELKGFFLYFFNTNAFGTSPVIVNGGGLNIRGKGASGTTISVPGDTGVVLQLMKRNNVWFWAQFS